MISPVRPRPKASGLTRMSVRSTSSPREGPPYGPHEVADAQLVGGPVALGSTNPAAPATGRSDPVSRRVRSPVVSRRRRVRREDGAGAPTSASQNGQIFHIGSSGLPHALQGSISLRRQLGQRRKSFSTS